MDKDLNGSHEKLLGENIREKLLDTDLRSNFLDMTPKKKKKKIGNRSRNTQWDCINLKSFCTVKETILKMK